MKIQNRTALAVFHAARLLWLPLGF